MTEAELLKVYSEKNDHLEAFGCFVCEHFKGIRLKAGFSEQDFCIPPSSRVKDPKSFVNKALYRGKSYNNPLEDITDQVGVRFVFLTQDKVDGFGELIESTRIFSFSKDRDFESERLKNPTIFVYQSNHYIIALKEPTVFKGKEFGINIRCELQVRTLLQHAYSELTHDTIYKPKSVAEPQIYRLVARSMALIEATDDIFFQVSSYFINIDKQTHLILEGLFKRYKDRVLFSVDERLTSMLTDAFKEKIESESIESIYSFIESKEYIFDRIRERNEEMMLYRQPIVFFIYYISNKYPTYTKKTWPFLPEILRRIFIDLGLSFETI
ncbi:RelA/SpoT domain-containing protein [Aminivibrio sp.]